MRFAMAIVTLTALAALPVVQVACTGERAAHTESAGVTHYNCPMHPTYIRDAPGTCPICGMDLVVMGASGSATRQSADSAVYIDARVIQNMGVSVDTARRITLSRKVSAGGVIATDERSRSQVNARVMGWVEKVLVSAPGVEVGAGQVLITVYSPELLSFQNELLNAAARSDSVVLAGARERLRSAGVSDNDIAEIERSRQPLRAVPVRARRAGVVIEKRVIEGQSVEPGAMLYELADLRSVWVIANVFLEDVSLVKRGAASTFTLQAWPGRSFAATVDQVLPAIEAGAVTVPVRLVAGNTADRAVKPGMYAQVSIGGSDERSMLAVPSQAVIRTGTRSLVVLALGGGRFLPVEVVTGVSQGGMVEVISGVSEGVAVVASAQFLIDSESNLRAAAAHLEQAAKSVAVPQEVDLDSIAPGTYYCPMCPGVVSSEPARCPRCGMKLVLRQADSTHEHVN